jgi:hypothetical protein
VDPNEVKGVTYWPQPKNAKGVQGFLGLTHYKKFIKDYGKIAMLLTKVAKKEEFKWGASRSRSF